MSQQEKLICDKMHNVLNEIVDAHTDKQTLSEIDDLVVEGGVYMDLELYNEYGYITVGHYRDVDGFGKPVDSQATFELVDGNLVMDSFQNAMGNISTGRKGYDFIENVWADNLDNQGFTQK